MKLLYLVFLGVLMMASEVQQSSNYNYDKQGRPVIPDKEELKKLPRDGGMFWNRLVFEGSPYLLQHAANPVNWYPWGEEAFNIAKSLIRDTNNLWSNKRSFYMNLKNLYASFLYYRYTRLK